MPWLTGFHNPTGLRPALLIPLFVGWQGGNRYLIQQIGPADNVTSFIDFDGELNCHLQLQKIELNVGDQSLWGVEFRSGDISFGSVTDIAPVLRKKLSQNEFSEHPWLGAEIAALCGDIARYNRYLRGLFKGLWEQAPIAAEVWRDNVVLLPIVRQELADRLRHTPTRQPRCVSLG